MFLIELLLAYLFSLFNNLPYSVAKLVYYLSTELKTPSYHHNLFLFVIANSCSAGGDCISPEVCVCKTGQYGPDCGNECTCVNGICNGGDLILLVFFYILGKIWAFLIEISRIFKNDAFNPWNTNFKTFLAIFLRIGAQSF